MLTDQGLELDRFRLKIEAADELGFEQNFIFIIALPRVKVMASRQCVGFGVLLAGHITEGKMIVCEFREPTSLSVVKFLRLLEIGKVLMIGPDLKGMCCAHEVMTPLGKGDHDREHFSIINLIIALGGS